jgi:hypothetical protein
MKRWVQLADDVALLQFPWRVFGIDFKRNVTLLRLPDGRLIIHSTAPFEPDDVSAIRRFGKPAWLVEATLIHDTFAKEGRAAFPDLPYYAPADFAQASGVATESLGSPPPDWAGEIEVLEIAGLRRPNEHAFFHRASRTLVLADLLFHFPSDTTGWGRFFTQRIMRLPRLVGMSILFRMMIRDQEAFARSMRQMLEWDFERIVVGHAEPVEEDAKTTLIEGCRDRGISLFPPRNDT